MVLNSTLRSYPFPGAPFPALTPLPCAGPAITEVADPSREEEAALEAQNAAKEEEAEVGGEDEPED